MKQDNSGRSSDGGTPHFQRVADPDQARFLDDPASRRFFEPFLARERTVSQAARELGVALDTMFYRVRRMLDLGLIQVVREEPRAGRALKIYRSVHDGYFVPFGVTPHAELEERIRQGWRSDEERVARAMARALREGEQEGRRLHRPAGSEAVWVESAGEGGKPLTWHDVDAIRQQRGTLAEVFSMELQLDEAQGRELLVTLYRLAERAQRESEANHAADRGRPFWLQFVLFPVESPD